MSYGGGCGSYRPVRHRNPRRWGALAATVLWLAGSCPGPGAADADLFRGRKVILTPVADTDGARQAEVEGWWSATGALVETMDPEQHDAVYARFEQRARYSAGDR